MKLMNISQLLLFIAVLAIATTTVNASIILDNETLAASDCPWDYPVEVDTEHLSTFCHDAEGALIINGYYPDYKQLSAGSTTTDPAVSIMNWYGTNRQTFYDVRIEATVNEAGREITYGYAANLSIGSGFDTKFVLSGLAAKKRNVTRLAIRYYGIDLSSVDDSWAIPQHLIQSEELNYEHVLKRIPDYREDNGMTYRTYAEDDRGEIVRFTQLLW